MRVLGRAEDERVTGDAADGESVKPNPPVTALGPGLSGVLGQKVEPS